MKPATPALILMLNAIRLQLFAAQMDEPSKELRECLEGSAWMAGEAMRQAGLMDVPPQQRACHNPGHCHDHGLEEFDGCLGCASAAAIRRHRAICPAEGLSQDVIEDAVDDLRSALHVWSGRDDATAHSYVGDALAKLEGKCRE